MTIPKTKFIVSFTTSPTRIHKCSQMIHSILDQTRKPDLFLLNIPEEFARTGESYIVPKYIRKSLKVNRIPMDYGPATKIVPTVAYLTDSDRSHEYDPNYTRIIYLDDDIAYPKRMIESYERMIAPNDDNVWTTTDIATIAEGYGSVCVKLNTFYEDFIRYMTHYTANDNQICRLSDDIILSNYYHRRNVGIIIMNIRGFLSIQDIWDENRILDYGNEDDALHMVAGGTSDNNVDRYKRVITALNKAKDRKFKISFITTETDETTGVMRNTLVYR
jgi:hypothetical protein